MDTIQVRGIKGIFLDHALTKVIMDNYFTSNRTFKMM